MFYRKLTSGNHIGAIKGFPLTKGSWCKNLKLYAMSEYIRDADIREDVLSRPRKEEHYRSIQAKQPVWISNANQPVVQKTQEKSHNSFESQTSSGRDVPKSNSVFSESPVAQGAKTNIVQYLGIAADEPDRIVRHTRPGIMLPLVMIGWDEAFCRSWCEENDLLSPIYTEAQRGGCWFCHNQGVDQLRKLRKNYPDLWNLLLKWDLDSPTTFNSDGHTVHDFDKRFQMEDNGLLTPNDKRFRWKQVLENNIQ